MNKVAVVPFVSRLPAYAAALIQTRRLARRQGSIVWLCLAALGDPALAQTSPASPQHTLFGAGIGMGNIPGAFRPVCGRGLERKTPAASADLRLGRAFGAGRVESSTGVRGAAVMEACLYIGPIGQDGIQTLRYSDMRRGEGMTLSDVRLVHAGGAGNSWWLIMGGWRSGFSFRLGLELRS